MVNTLIEQKQNFDDKCLKVIDKSLREIFGEKATLIIFKHLEISEKMDVFVDALEELLSSGANIVKKKILEKLYSSYGIIYKPEFERAETNMNFVSQIKMLQ